MPAQKLSPFGPHISSIEAIFQVPTIPPNAVIQSIYATENFSYRGTVAFINISLNTPLNNDFYQGNNNAPCRRGYPLRSIARVSLSCSIWEDAPALSL
jgi:hypothetical protein